MPLKITVSESQLPAMRREKAALGACGCTGGPFFVLGRCARAAHGGRNRDRDAERTRGWRGPPESRRPFHLGTLSRFMLRRVADSASEPLIMLDIPRDIMQHEKGAR
jgi:hypothetical protein